MKTKKGYGMEGGSAGGGKPQIASRPRGDGPYNDYNWTRPDGTYVLKDWASDVWDDFSQGWGCFQRKEDKKWNFVDADGRLLSDVWFDSAKPFGKTDGDPAAVKIDGRWHALYGKGTDGGADLSKGSTDAAGIDVFSCGMALVWKIADTRKNRYGYADAKNNRYGYVDASMNAVGPDEFPFVMASDFDPGCCGGRWTRVTLPGQNNNLMGRDGTLAFGPAPFFLRTHEWGGGLLASPAGDKGRYRFPASKGWSEIAHTGISDYGMRSPLEGRDGRLTLRDAWDRETGRRSACMVAADSNGREHIVCFLDGKGLPPKE